MAGETINYAPAVMNNPPFGNQNLNPQGSNYPSDSAYSPEETNLIQKAIMRKIFYAAPEQYNMMKLVFSKTPHEENLDEFEYLEQIFGRAPVIAGANASAVVAVPATVVTQAITLDAGMVTRLSRDIILGYPDGEHRGTVTNIVGNVITVSSYTGKGLPAVTDGDIFYILSTVQADGMDSFSNYSRIETVTRYNYIQWFARAERWTRLERQKFINAGTTDYYERAREEKLRQIRIDMFNSFWNGDRGEVTISLGKPAKAMGGIYPMMLAAGSANASPTLAGFKDSFETLAFRSGFKQEGSTRFLCGTQETLYNFSKIYKQPGLRYEPNDDIAKLGLKKIEFGAMNFVMVPCELWREPSCFPASWAKKLICLDMDTVQPVKMKGIPTMQMGSTLDRGENGTREDYKDFWVVGQLSIRFNNPLSSFYMDIK